MPVLAPESLRRRWSLALSCVDVETSRFRLEAMIGLPQSLPDSDLIRDGDFVILDEYNALADFKTVAVMSEDSAAEVRHSLPLL